jgi:hypothetical protein
MIHWIFKQVTLRLTLTSPFVSTGVYFFWFVFNSLQLLDLQISVYTFYLAQRITEIFLLLLFFANYFLAVFATTAKDRVVFFFFNSIRYNEIYN